MIRRSISVILLGLLALAIGCSNKHVKNPIADVNSKQPDKVLFDRAMDAMKHNRFDVARMTLQTLINTYPDSEYVARAKLAVGDSWYAEGGSAALAQAEIEYKDFITFFPNMAEAAEAQLKVANIHYRQMEKPDRDFTHAKRAEEEYRQLILQFPDSKLVPEAKQRLLEVQEVLAEREFRIGRFYYLRESWPAAIARLQSLSDTYPLYSGADDALFMLGDAYEHEIARVRAAPDNRVPPAAKKILIDNLTNQASTAYSRIITRYPVMSRAEDAKKRLAALHRPIPTPTPQAVAQNKAEEESRGSGGHLGRVMSTFHRRPDVTEAAKVGDPTLVDPKQTSATDFTHAVAAPPPALAAGAGPSSVAGEIVGTGTPPAGEAVPHSSEAAGPAAQAQPGNPSNGDSSSGIPELVPTTPAPAQPTAPAPAPQQLNEATASADNSSATAQSSQTSQSSDSSDSSSSKKKKKKKLFPF